MANFTDRTIRLRGVRVDNLKNIDLDLPLDRLVVFSGVSGSGKSSLAFDTLFAEGQRRYVETFSPYTRQFLEQLGPPDADGIEGIPPAIGVSQRVGQRSVRSTVGTITEIHDYLALLFAREGRVVCLSCGEEVRPANPQTVSQYLDGLLNGSRYMIAFPWEIQPDSDRAALANALREDGFVRVRIDGQIVPVSEGPLPMPANGMAEVIVDRLVRGSEAPQRRLDSIETAFQKGLGRCVIVFDDDTRTFYRAWRCARCGRAYPEPDPRLFSYVSPLGACRTCEGSGQMIDLDLDRIVPDRSKSLAEGAIAPWTTPAYQEWNHRLLRWANEHNVSTTSPFALLSPESIQQIVEGSEGFPGVRGFLRWLEKKSYKMHIRVFLSRWRRHLPCPDCQGARLRPESLAFQIDGIDIAALSALPITGATERLRRFAAQIADSRVARTALDPALSRLDYLDRIGLGYLSLNRPARTLSGGEGQRVTLTGALCAGLVNTLYVLDEPTRGLHPSDVGRLIDSMKSLRDRGNSLVVVEHETAVLRSADWLIDIGPGAGDGGGQVIYAGSPGGIEGAVGLATGDYLAGRKGVLGRPPQRRPAKGTLRLRGASGHNLKCVDLDLPLGAFCVVTGVSGSGKSTLIEETLFPALLRHLRGDQVPSEPYNGLEGVEALKDVALVDQSPIGRSARSNPVTYLKVFDEIRKTFAETHEAKVRNYSPSRFSFNLEGGRCNACEGNGYLTIDMQFLPDVMVRCPECRGTRFRAETLEVTYRGKNIAEVLDLTVRESFGFFRNKPMVQSKLRPLLDVGLDYLRLGQPSSTLSGGEAQRLKLASLLGATQSARAMTMLDRGTLFLLDEPTAGLHPADIAKLLEALNRLVDLGNSLVVIEHSTDVMRAADWIIDLGPGAGDKGGRIVAAGTPENVADQQTPTGRALLDALNNRPGSH